MIAGKVWGSTQCLLSTPFIEIHRLFIKPRAQCSLHMHRYKWNAFLVLSGELVIEVEKNSYKLTDTTVLTPGEMTMVQPGEYHRFLTRGIPCSAIELYYCEPLGEDIVRRDHGKVRR